MSDEGSIPTLTDLIESGDQIKMSDLGLDDELEVESVDPDQQDIRIDASASDLVVDDPFLGNPALEHAIHDIIEKHMELAWQEIRRAIEQELKKP
ncbi:MAG: hypothetical protein JSU67_04965 [Gammaproteobacteria bacterium]|nr:MAG: hypothetical protein JSU67_04965 [Gammaproteobacteria bacterium]